MSIIPQPRPSRRDRVSGGGSAAVAVEPRAPTGTLVVRLLFGAAWAIDAVLKWLPGFRHTFISQLRHTAYGQPSWLHWWFHDWIVVQSHAPGLFVTLAAVMETLLALVLLLGVARRAGYLVGIFYSLLVWSVGEGFGGPYMSSSTDIGASVMYALLFGTLLVFAPPARRERLSLDRSLVTRWSWWRFLAEPQAADRR